MLDLQNTLKQMRNCQKCEYGQEGIPSSCHNSACGLGRRAAGGVCWIPHITICRQFYFYLIESNYLKIQSSSSLLLLLK